MVDSLTDTIPSLSQPRSPKSNLAMSNVKDSRWQTRTNKLEKNKNKWNSGNFLFREYVMDYIPSFHHRPYLSISCLFLSFLIKSSNDTVDVLNFNIGITGIPRFYGFIICRACFQSVTSSSSINLITISIYFFSPIRHRRFNNLSQMSSVCL